MALKCVRALGPLADRDAWLRAMAAAKGADCRFDEVERLIGDGREPADNRRVWDSLGAYEGPPAGLGTLVHMARETGATIRAARRDNRGRRKPRECRRQLEAADPYWFHAALLQQLKGSFGFDEIRNQRRWRRRRSGTWEPCEWRDALKRLQATLPERGFADWGRKADRLVRLPSYRAGIREWLEIWLTVPFPARERHVVPKPEALRSTAQPRCLMRTPRRAEEVLPVRIDPDEWPGLFASAGCTADMARTDFCKPVAGVLYGYLDRATWMRLVQLVEVRGLLGGEGERFVTLTGVGGSGKGTFAALLKALLGPSKLKLNRQVFQPSRSGRYIPLKRLLQRNPRLAWIEEVGGSRMLSAAIKNSTGSDAERLEARAPYDR